MNGTPNDLNRGGYAVRVRCAGGGISHTSARMDKDAAEVLAGQFEAAIGRATDSEPFVRFQGERGEVRLRAERVTTIEVLSPSQTGVRWSPTEHGVPRETRPVMHVGEYR